MQNSKASNNKACSDSVKSANLSAVIDVNYPFPNHRVVVVDVKMWNRVLRALQKPKVPLEIRELLDAIVCAWWQRAAQPKDKAHPRRDNDL